MTRDWQPLYDLALRQGGYFTTRQAESLGLSRPLLLHWTRKGRFRQVFHGMLRIAAHQSIGPYDAALPYWIWCDGQCVFSHKTALHLHGVWAGKPPHEVFASMEPSVMKRRKAPRRFVLYRTDVPEEERTRLGLYGIAATTILRAVYDCVEVAEREGEHALPHSQLVAIVERIRASKRLGPADLGEAVAAVAKLAPKSGSR